MGRLGNTLGAEAAMPSAAVPLPSATPQPITGVQHLLPRGECWCSGPVRVTVRLLAVSLPVLAAWQHCVGGVVPLGPTVLC